MNWNPLQLPADPLLLSLEPFGTIHHYPKGHALALAGQPIKQLSYMLSGAAMEMKEYLYTPRILRYLIAGDFFGLKGLSGYSDHYSYTVRARTSCAVLTLPWSALEQWQRQHPERLKRLEQRLNRQWDRDLEGTLQHIAISHQPVVERVFAALQELATHPQALSHPQGRQVKVTRVELSQYLGCTREQVGKSYRTLIRQGLIQSRGSTTVVLDTAKKQEITKSQTAFSNPVNRIILQI